MGDWRRCENCRYIRHANDAGRSDIDTCPRCGAVYEKAAKLQQRKARLRVVNPHRKFRYFPCPQCREPVSMMARSCLFCEAPLKTPRPILNSIIAVGFVVMVGVSWLQSRTVLASPFPGVSDSHFGQCVELSIAWLDAKEHGGVTDRETIRAHSAWHSKCSVKALRDIALRSPVELPMTPQEWLHAVNNPVRERNEARL